ncbi:MAG: hypothetical protein ABIJ24_03135 [Nitrospinota bacterium]|nr:hypothetical protein [Nitrospinota bacterium]
MKRFAKKITSTSLILALSLAYLVSLCWAGNIYAGTTSLNVGHEIKIMSHHGECCDYGTPDSVKDETGCDRFAKTIGAISFNVSQELYSTVKLYNFPVSPLLNREKNQHISLEGYPLLGLDQQLSLFNPLYLQNSVLII